MSSFTKRKERAELPGTRTSLHNGQVLTSTGNPSLDEIIGGGMPLGSILLIEEDSFITYSRVLAKYFLAEGIVSDHSIFLGSIDVDPTNILEKLPKPVDGDNSLRSSFFGEDEKSSIIEKCAASSSVDMRIAWRYNELPKVNSEESIKKIGHHFNLLENMSKLSVNNADLYLWTTNNFETNSESDKNKLFYSPNYFNVLTKLSSTLKYDKFSNDNPNSLLRICLPSLGSPIWYDEDFNYDIIKFLTILKSMVRNSSSVCLLTMPTFLYRKYDDNLVHQIRSIVDISIELESFIGSQKATNPLFKDFNGIFHLRKMTAVNSLSVYTPETTDLAFKLRRKMFVIEKLHLPPELQTTEQSNAVPSAGCGDSHMNLLEF